MIGKKAHPIDDVRGVRLVMIICNHCPYVLFRMPAISKIVKEYNDRVHCIAVNSNDASPDTDDSSPEDAPEFMEDFKNKYGLACDYIFDEDHTIVYHGELDPSHTSNDLMPTGSSLRHALDLTLVGKSIDWEPNPSFGCSVKWKNL